VTTFSRATSSRHCPVCDGDHKCSLGDDGLILCGRSQGDVCGFTYLGQSEGDPQWGQYRTEGPTRNENGRHDKEDFRRQSWKAQADSYAANLTPVLSAELANVLGVPMQALACLDVGFNPNDHDGPCWTFPEVDAAGQAIGILRRFRTGPKKAMKHSKRGLIVPRGWSQTVGPAFLVEGPSDVLACVAMGLAVIGRPSNMGGVDHLAALLKDFPAERPIIAVGEFDPNHKGQWPGRDGAIKVASELAARLGRAVSWTLPPDKLKDIRAWLNAKNPDVCCQDEIEDLGQALSDSMVKNARWQNGRTTRRRSRT
jgi:putative DNA primase/helicase